jgi:hypothetical protein
VHLPGIEPLHDRATRRAGGPNARDEKEGDEHGGANPEDAEDDVEEPKNQERAERHGHNDSERAWTGTVRQPGEM